MNPTTPAAIIAAQAPAITSLILSRWRATTHHSAYEHAIYALVRLTHRARRAKDDTYATSDAFYEAALRKMVRTFGPIRRQTKIVQGGLKPFGTLLYQLERIKSYGVETSMGAVGETWMVHWGLSQEELLDVGQLAGELFLRCRSLGDSGLLVLAAPEPPPRVKKPYVAK